MSLESLSVWLASIALMVSTLAALFAAKRLSKAPALRSLQSNVDSLRSDFDEMQALLHRMDARDRMRSVRAARDDSSSPTPTTKRPKNGARPDPVTDPAGWKAYMRKHHPPGQSPTPQEPTE